MVCEVTSIALATVVVTLGVAWVSASGVACPLSTSMGFEVSTPEKLAMPPTAPLFDESVQL